MTSEEAKIKFESFRNRGRHTYVKACELRIPDRVQRHLDKNWCRKQAALFNPDAFGEIIVSLRDGHYNIVDGQHRIYMVREILGWGDQLMPCFLMEGLSESEEADLFLTIGIRRALRTFDGFRIALVATRKMEVEINAAAVAHGLRISAYPGPGNITAVAALRSIYSGARVGKPGARNVDITLGTLVEAWGKVPTAFEAPLMQGLGMVLMRYPDLDIPALVKKLSKISPGKVIAVAKNVREAKRRSMPNCVAASIVDIYNSHRAKTITDWWRDPA